VSTGVGRCTVRRERMFSCFSLPCRILFITRRGVSTFLGRSALKTSNRIRIGLIGSHPAGAQPPTYDLGSATCSRSSITSKQGSSTYTPCLNKKQAKFKLPPNLIVFGTKMANSPKLYEVHSFSTSPNSRQCTTVLNAHVQNWYITL